MPKILVVCGATASGKTSLAVACAKKLNTEIISADSLLVYRGLNVGTAKPTEEEKAGIVHHLIDVVDPNQEFSVNDYEKMALPIVERLLKDGKTPVICGGTGFYINSLLYKSQFGNVGANEEIRAKYEQIMAEKGNEYLHDILKEKDPQSAVILHPNDTKRIIRALEIFDVTGKKKSEQNDAPIPRFEFVCVSIDYSRAELYERIDKRVEIMFENGLKDEVCSLLENGLDENAQCMQGIGYKEIVEGVNKGQTDKEIKEIIQKNTRNYAKRQITFFKRMKNHYYLAPCDATAENVLRLL